MTTVNANDIVMGVESFGDDDAPLVLLAGGVTMLSWPVEWLLTVLLPPGRWLSMEW